MNQYYRLCYRLFIMSMLVTGCTSEESTSVSLTSSQRLHPVALPDISRLATPVQQQLHDAFTTLTAALEQTGSTDTDRAEHYGQLGRLLLAAELGGIADLCFQHAEHLMPQDHRWPYFLGHSALLLENRTQAINSFQRAHELAPTDPATLVWLAETHLDDGRAAEAEALFLRATSFETAAAAARFGAGRAALARRAYTDAIAHLQATLATNPDASAVHYPLAMAYRAVGDRDRAATHLQQRGESWPPLPDPLMAPLRELLRSVTVYEIRGRDALQAGDWSAAADAFHQGLELEPNDPALRHELGTALYGSGDVDSAQREFRTVIRQSPNFANSRISLATILSLRGNYSEAVKEFSLALQTHPNSVEGRFGLAEVLRVSGQVEAALGEYERVLKLDPTVVEAWVGFGAALITLERYQQAHELHQDAQRVHPNHPQLRELAALLPPI